MFKYNNLRFFSNGPEKYEHNSLDYYNMSMCNTEIGITWIKVCTVQYWSNWRTIFLFEYHGHGPGNGKCYDYDFGRRFQQAKLRTSLEQSPRLISLIEYINQSVWRLHCILEICLVFQTYFDSLWFVHTDSYKFSYAMLWFFNYIFFYFK